jgi:hypothetical protein
MYKSSLMHRRLQYCRRMKPGAVMWMGCAVVAPHHAHLTGLGGRFTFAFFFG